MTNGKSDVVPIFLHQDMTKTPKEVYRILQMFRYFCPENNKKGKNKIGFVNIKQKDDFISWHIFFPYSSRRSQSQPPWKHKPPSQQMFSFNFSFIFWFISRFDYMKNAFLFFSNCPTLLPFLAYLAHILPPASSTWGQKKWKPNEFIN